MTQQKGTQMQFDDWKRVANPWRVVEAAKSDERARDAAVSRIIDTMLELQLDYRHDNPGFQPFSVTALAGEVPGGGGRSDQAMLMQAARIRPEKMGHSIWMVTASQMIERQEVLLRALGLNEGVRHFESVEALQVAGRRARKRLWQVLAVGEVG